MRAITAIDNRRIPARQCVPPLICEYVDADAWTESAYRADKHDLQRGRPCPTRTRCRLPAKNQP